jgi:hypothetical protein
LGFFINLTIFSFNKFTGRMKNHVVLQRVVKIWSSSMHARGGGGGEAAAVDCTSFVSVFSVMNYCSLIFAKRSMQAASVFCCF